MTQYDDTTASNNGSTPLPLPEADRDRPVLVAYPLSIARRDGAGRWVLDPSQLPRAAAAVPAAPRVATISELSLLLLIGTVALIFDQVTKRLIEGRIPLYTESVPIEAFYPYFRFTHTANYGAAFGVFQSGGLLFGVVAAVVAVVILYYNLVLPPGQRLLRVALGLQLGGALGNLMDRLRLGYVTDFMDVDVSTIVNIPYISDWPIFNLADMAIVSGVILLAYLMITDGDQLGGPAPVVEQPAAAPQAVADTPAEETLPGVTIYDAPQQATVALAAPPAVQAVAADKDPDPRESHAN